MKDIQSEFIQFSHEIPLPQFSGMRAMSAEMFQILIQQKVIDTRIEGLVKNISSHLNNKIKPLNEYNSTDTGIPKISNL